MAPAKDNLMDKIVSLAKRRGFVFPGSEIYGGLANSWDYGPLGVELKNNIKNLWWARFVHRRDDMVGLDSAIIMNSKVWEKSGHLSIFSDPLAQCETCKREYRADSLIDDMRDFAAVQKEFIISGKDAVKLLVPQIDKHLGIQGGLMDSFDHIFKKTKSASLTEEEKRNISAVLNELIDEAKEENKEAEEKINLITFIEDQLVQSAKYSGIVTQAYLNRYTTCPNCGDRKWGVPRQFNLMMKTFLGPSEEQANTVYFRPETAQGMFVDFKNIMDATHRQLPFGVAQIGKAFRNEITPGNFIFRTREFEQMEIEYFIAPPSRDDDWKDYFEIWRKEMYNWMRDDLGLDMAHVHELEVPKDERAHYSKRTIDFEFDFPFGRKELYGLAYRTDFDLKNHYMEAAPYSDAQTGEKFWPHVIEPTWGVDRSVLAVLVNSYAETDKHVVLKLPPKIAPYKAAVFPLLANKEPLVAAARKIYDDLRKQFMVAWDDRGNIGKRYYSQDEIGTPYCITVDFDTLGEEDGAKKGTVTVRDRDTGTQERVAIDKLALFLLEKTG